MVSFWWFCGVILVVLWWDFGGGKMIDCFLVCEFMLVSNNFGISNIFGDDGKEFR